MQEAEKRSGASAEADTDWHKKLGPGLITGAADDDPSGIATYSQAGAQFGYHMLWTLFLTFPLMVGIQVVSARIGRVTGEGLSGNIRRNYSSWLLYAIVGMLTVAKGVLPLALYGPEGYAWRSALLATPARFAQVAGPLAFGLILDRSAAAAVIASSALCLTMFAMTLGLSRRSGPEAASRRDGSHLSYAVYSGALPLRHYKSPRRKP